MSIEIDGIRFTLLCKSVADNLTYKINEETRPDAWGCHRDIGFTRIDNLRDIVKFTSTSIRGTKTLYAYRSTSELGIWRLGYLERKRCSLNEFSLDYVQGTLLHHLLQKFINENFETLPFISEPEGKPKPGSGSGTILETSNLNLYNKGLTEAQIHDPEFLKTHKFILLDFSTDEDTHAINSDRKLELEPFSSIGIKCDTKTKETIIRDELGILSSNIKSAYHIANNEHITDYRFEEPNENIWDCTISIFKVDLIKNEGNPDSNVILVYCKYVMEYGTAHNRVSGCFGIALLKNTTVNEYGLYSQFIDAGIYICKPIDYSSRFLGDKTRRECSDRYTFVGDRYDNVFPYSELLDGVPSSGGMRKPRITRKSKKSKKIQKKSKKIQKKSKK